jgi:hypothetical protein
MQLNGNRRLVNFCRVRVHGTENYNSLKNPVLWRFAVKWSMPKIISKLARNAQKCGWKIRSLIYTVALYNAFMSMRIS